MAHVKTTEKDNIVVRVSDAHMAIELEINGRNFRVSAWLELGEAREVSAILKAAIKKLAKLEADDKAKENKFLNLTGGPKKR